MVKLPVKLNSEKVAQFITENPCWFHFIAFQTIFYLLKFEYSYTEVAMKISSAKMHFFKIKKSTFYGDFTIPIRESNNPESEAPLFWLDGSFQDFEFRIYAHS